MSRFTRYTPYGPQRRQREEEKNAWQATFASTSLLLTLLILLASRPGSPPERNLPPTARRPFLLAPEIPSSSSRPKQHATAPQPPEIPAEIPPPIPNITPIAPQEIRLPEIPSPPPDENEEFPLTAPPTEKRTSGSDRPSAQRPRKEDHLTPPVALRTPQPPYPPSLRRQRLQGEVYIRIIITPQGIPESVEILRSSGHAELDAAARQHILKHWKFLPATRNAMPIGGSVRILIKFKLS